MPLQTLQSAFASATWPVALNAAFLTANGVVAPDGFDALLIRSFALGSATTALSLGRGTVGTVTGDTFSITGATLAGGLSGATAAQAVATLSFTQPADPSAAVQVVIATAMPSGWRFAAGFPFMTGASFDQLAFGQTAFIFATAPGPFTWPPGSGSTVALSAGMTFAGTLTLSAAAQTVLGIANIAGASIPNPLVMSGPFDASGCTGDVIYPVMSLSAPVSTATFTFLIFTIEGPFIGFAISAVPAELAQEAQLALPDGGPATEQAVSSVFGATVTAATTPCVSLDFTVLLRTGASTVSVAMTPKKARSLTPADIASIAGVPAGFISSVPAPLQQYFTTVGLSGLSAVAVIPKTSSTPVLSSVSVALATLDGFSLTLVDDPSGKFNITLTSLELDWTVLNPTGDARHMVLFSTTFTLMPSVFKNKDGSDGGEFSVSIDQDYTIEAAFDGQVALADLLPAVTGGLVRLPSGVSVTFEDIVVNISPSTKSYSFSMGVDAAVDIITWQNKPLIQLQGMQLALSASTPSGKGAVTTYSASLGGLITVGPVALRAGIAYEGAATPPVWTLAASLAAPLDLGTLLGEIFATSQPDTFLPDFLPKELVVQTFAVAATIPTGASGAARYDVSGSLDWTTEALAGLSIACTADLSLSFDGSRPSGSQFSGAVLGTIAVNAISGLTLTIGYKFNQPGSNAAGSVLTVQWEGVTGTYDGGQQSLTLTLNGWSLGSLITKLVALAGDPYFALSSPWDVLNSISLDGFSLTFHMKSGATTTVSASYTLSASIRLGFINIDGINFARDPATGKVLLSISGSSPLQSQPGWQNLFNPDPTKGQDVQNMPSPPGRGNALFDLRLLALGQHVAINAADMSSTQQVIRSLEKIPSTEGASSNPVNPNSKSALQPFYSAQSNWLIAADLGLLGVRATDKDPYVYAIELMVVFNDPNLYGLRLALSGERVKVLDGLSIDIMYKKVTETVGVYQLDFQFPKALRQLTFGAVNVTLPNIGIQIYTNGDFLIDFGFPYNLDFSVSFAIQALIGPVPAMGAGGFYFGKLSNATATSLPTTTKGTFDPVIVFGLGLQVGLGYSIDKGVLSAGFSVTFFGIIEGIIAPWHPYEGHPSGADVQSDTYFMIKGQFGIQGRLYGSINFAIISASVNVLVQLVAQVTYQSFRAIPLSISASVSVSVSVKIDLGLFSFSISFSFSTTISENMTIGQDATAPWDEGVGQNATALPNVGADQAARRIRPRRRTGGEHHVLLARRVLPRLAFAPFPRAQNAVLPQITIVLTPQYTVLVPDVTRPTLDAQQGAFVALLSMDAPSADGTGNASGSSFATLCSLLLPWIIASHPAIAPAAHGPDAMNDEPIPVETLQQIINTLADPNQQPALAAFDILAFLQNSFTVNLVTQPTADQQTALQNGAVLFPIVPGLILSVPDPANAANTVAIDFANWAQVTQDYRTAMLKAFNNVAATLDFTNNLNPSAQPAASGTAQESLAQVVFEDAFAMISRQLLQAAVDAYDSFPYALQKTDSLGSIMSYAQGGMGRFNNPAFTYADLVLANLQVPVSGGVTLILPNVTYCVQSADTLAIIAGLYSDPASSPRYVTTPAGLISANQASTAILRAGVPIGSTVTLPGDSFDALMGRISVDADQLAALIQDTTNLLRPSATILVPPIAYTTVAAGTDTLGALLPMFGITADDLVSVAGNLSASGIFDAAAEPLIHLANLDELTGTQLAQAVAAGETIGQTAGMVSRFMLHGLRLPNTTGLALPSGFLYPSSGQPDYGLYQLTGQQFPVGSSSGSTYSVTLTAGSGLSWIRVNGATGVSSGTLDLTKAAATLGTVLAWAQGSGYNPSAAGVDPPLTLEPQSPVTLVPQQFAAAGFSRWTTSGMDEIAAVTAPAAAQVLAAGTAERAVGQNQPILWQIPASLLSQVETQQAALTGSMSLAAAIGYLPVVAPVTLTTDPATQATAQTPVSQFTYATRVDFRIRRLSQSAGAQTQTSSRNTLFPPGDGNQQPVTELAPNAYQLIGPDPSEAVLLERALVQIEALGTSMITGVLVAYAATGTGQSGLIGHATTDVFTFITRANLSTQANPPSMTSALWRELGAEPSPINDMQNQPGEFLRLMWELTTVQSGGYAFYWDGAASGATLPAGLFDADGFATLTLLITWARSGPLAPGARLTNCCNAVLTADAIDTTQATLALASQNAPATTNPQDGDTLASLAARYGMTPGTFARANPAVPLASGGQFTLGSVYHQVSAADVASGTVLATVAAYYSHNAAQPITAAQLQAYNGIVSPVLSAVLMIPPITYVVASHDTLGAIASWFGLAVEAIGSMAAEVTGLVASSQAVSVDPIAYSASQVLGTGNLGLRLTRANLGTPDPASPTGYPQACMFSLYSLLDAAFAPNVFFNASTPTMPFGPAASDDDSAGSTAHARLMTELRHPRTRRARLAALAAQPAQTYQQTLRVRAGSTKNAAPADPAGNLPPASANPYAGVGSIAQIALRWLDVFGNQTSTPFNAPPSGYSGPLNDMPVPVSYTDLLIGPGQWPNVSLSYQYTGPAGAPLLTISFALNTLPYAPSNGTPATAAVNDAKLFNQAYFQLNQNYDGLGIPGLSGPAVTVSLINALTGAAPQPLDATNAAALVQFVTSCAAYVNAAALGTPPATSPAATLSLPVQLGSVVANNIVRLRVMLVLNRLSSLITPDLLDVSGSATVQVEIPPYTYVTITDNSGTPAADPAPPADALTPFATAMEQAFVTADWRMRVGAGPQDPDEPTANQTHTVWAVRFSVGQSGQGLSFALGTQPVFFAPRPVATALVTGEVRLPVYTTGTGLSPGTSLTSFTGADLNEWMAQALTAVDTFLSAAYATPAFIMDRLGGFDPDQDGLLAAILGHKSAIARTIGSTVGTIFASDQPTAAMTSAATKAMEQSALQLLANATAVTAVAVTAVDGATTNEPLPPGASSPPALYGQPVNIGVEASAGTLGNYTLSTGTIPLNAEGAQDDSSTLSFLFTSANPSLQTVVPLTLAYNVTHVRAEITDVPGITGYQQSTWIAFVTGPLTYDIGSTTTDFPVVLRALPPPPAAQMQTAVASPTDGTPAQLPNWSYTFTFSASWTAQDQLVARVSFNSDASSALGDSTPSTVLFQSLAAMISLAPDIFADFDASLRKLNSATSTADAVYVNALAAVSAFKDLVGGVATAYADWAKPTLSGEDARLTVMASGPAPLSLRFTISLIDVSGVATIEVTFVDSPPSGAPIPVVLLDPASCKAILYSPATPPPNLLAAYQYMKEDKSYLSYLDASTLPARTIQFQDLSVLAYQKAETEIEIRRNGDLDPTASRLTATDFIFTTPPVAFATPARPLIVRQSVDLNGIVSPSPASLSAYLTTFFSQMLGNDGADWVTAQVQSSATYALSQMQGAPCTTLPINLMLPTAPNTATITALATAVGNWLTANRSYLAGPNATLEFTIVLYSTLPDDIRPLLKIDSAFVAIDNVS